MWIVPISILHQLALVSRKQHSSSLGCHFFCRLQNSPYFCVFKYVWAVQQKIWNEAENSKTLTPRFTDFFTDFEKKKRLFCSLLFLPSFKGFHLRELSPTNIFTRTVKSNKCLHTKGDVYSILCLIKYSLSIKLSDRRQELVDKLFKNVLQNEQNKLHELLPARNTCTFNLRNMWKFKPAFKTNRFRSSFITFNALKAWTVLVDF